MSPARASIRNRAGLAGLAAAALCLAACIMGGTGTDTENGLTGKDKVNANDLKGISARVTDSLGAPLRGVSLRLFDPAFRPDSGLAPADVVANNAEGRRQAMAPYLGWIGTRWFVLPNATYGSWEPALFNNDWSQSRTERRRQKEAALRTH